MESQIGEEACAGEGWGLRVRSWDWVEVVCVGSRSCALIWEFYVERGDCGWWVREVWALKDMLLPMGGGLLDLVVMIYWHFSFDT